jgi:hypothetical protein
MELRGWLARIAASAGRIEEQEMALTEQLFAIQGHPGETYPGAEIGIDEHPSELSR